MQLSVYESKNVSREGMSKTDSLSLDCEVCKEKLDNRDLLKDNIVCWKCGWKVPLANVISIEHHDQEWLDELFDGLMYPAD